MKRFLSSCLTIFLLVLLSSCTETNDPARLQVTASVYPMAIVTRAVCEGVPGVSVEQMAVDAGSCVHDYNLSVSDLKKLEDADMLVLNGAGLESFLEDLFEKYPDLFICNTGEGIEVRTLEGHHHDNEEVSSQEETDPHLWMNPLNLIQQTEVVASALSEMDPVYADQYRENAEHFCDQLLELDHRLEELLEPLSCRELITFHEGFGYFADRYGFHVHGIEEEAGGEASAKELVYLIDEIRQEEIPAVFYEEYGSDRSALVLSRECEIPACSLSMLMNGDGTVEEFLDMMLHNGEVIAEVYAK